MTTLTFIGTAFIIGYLLGDRRGVKQANEILDHNNGLLLKAMGDAAADIAPNIEPDESDEIRPTLH